MITIDGDDWKIEDPTPYHFLLVTDFIQNPDTPARLKNDSFTAFYFVFVCLINDTGYLSEQMTYEEFLKKLSLKEMSRLKKEVERFRDLVNGLDEEKDDKNKGEE